MTLNANFWYSMYRIYTKQLHRFLNTYNMYHWDMQIVADDIQKKQKYCYERYLLSDDYDDTAYHYLEAKINTLRRKLTEEKHERAKDYAFQEKRIDDLYDKLNIVKRENVTLKENNMYLTRHMIQLKYIAEQKVKTELQA